MRRFIVGVIVGVGISAGGVAASTFVETTFNAIYVTVTQGYDPTTQVLSAPDLSVRIVTLDAAGNIVNGREVDAQSAMSGSEKSGCLTCFNAVKARTRALASIGADPKTPTPRPSVTP